MADVLTIAEGIGLTEGPLWTTGGELLVTSVSRGRLFRVALEGGSPALPVADCGGGPSGMAEGTRGEILVAQNGDLTQRSSSPRKVTAGLQMWRGGTDDVIDIATDDVGVPNDCTMGPDGRLWYTDPAGDPYDSDGLPGRVRAYDVATGATQICAEGSRFPNGIAFTPDGTALFVAETGGRCITRLEYSSGDVHSPTVFATLPAGFPDGIAFDAVGSLYVAATSADCVFVFDDSARLVEEIPLGSSWPTSVAFAGSARDVLVITAARGGRVLALRRDVPGAGAGGATDE